MTGVRAAILCLLLPAAITGPAAAQDPADSLAIATGPDGIVSTWAVAGPYLKRTLGPLDAPGADLRPEIGAAAAAPEGDGRWTLVATDDDAVNLRTTPRDLRRGAPPGKRRVYYAAVVLTAGQPGRAFVGLGGSVGTTLAIGGRVVATLGDDSRVEPDQRLFPVDLPAAETTLVVRSPEPPGPWGFSVRLTDDRHRRLARALRVPGAGPADAANSARLELRRRIRPDGWELVATGSMPAGGIDAEIPPPIVLRVRRGDETIAERAQESPPAPEGPRVELPFQPPGAGRYEVDVTWGHARRTFDLYWDPDHHEALSIAARGLERAVYEVSESTYDSVLYNVERLTRMLEEGEYDRPHIDRYAREVRALGEALLEGRDPYATLRGPVRKAYRSPLDGRLQNYSVYVPPGYSPDREWPVIVVLHGMGGMAHRSLSLIFGHDRGETESQEHADRYLPDMRQTDFFVLAPWGYGQSGYRNMGELDVLMSLEALRRDYRIDPRRTHVTGPSMGGIGAAGIPLRNPGLFATAAPLCGYHSWRIYNNVSNTRLRPWEDFGLGMFSNADWAENAEHLPMYLVHGTRDRPASSEVLVNRLRDLRYRVEYELREDGHNVWSETYQDGRMFGRLRGARLDPMPARVRFKTGRLRFNRSFWVRIDEPDAHSTWSEVTAEVRATDRVEVRTKNVRAITLSPDAPRVSSTGEIAYSLDGQDPIRAAAGVPAHFVRTEGRWQSGEPQRHGRKRPGLAGPIKDVWYEPLVFVYGTADPRQTAANRRTAEALARYHRGVAVRYPVKADVALTRDDIARRSLVLVGNPDSNAVVAAIAGRLPVQFDGAAIRVGSRRFEGEDVGVAFVHPNPENPDRYVLVVAGNTGWGTLLSTALPEVLPDWIVWDRRIEPARNEIVLGRGEVLGAGWFDSDWRVSE